MKLTKVQATNFRSVEDSEEFTLPQVTCLVGKNESGKTTLLQALYRMNPAQPEHVYNVTRDYPRRKLSDYDDEKPARILKTVWKLDDADGRALEAALGPEAKKIAEVTVSVSYPAAKDGSGSQLWTVSVDEKAVVKNLLAMVTQTAAERKANKFETAADVKKFAVAQSDTRYDALKAHLAKYFERDTAVRAAVDVLSPRLPKFVYFSQYDALKGRVQLEDLQAKRRDNRALEAHEQLFLDLCEFAGSDLDELAAIEDFENLKAKFEAAQSKITDQIFDYWTTNKYLSVEFSRDQGLAKDPAPFNKGRVFNTRIKNSLHQNTVSFDDRSAGFTWFFSFLVLFSQTKKRFGKNVILLLDEPGLNLHAQAQSDLLRYFKDKLEPEHQVIYTTHSLFMVPPENLLSVRIVEDVIIERPNARPETKGTKVRSDVMGVTNETLFPLQGALGFEITQTLFVGKHTLMVEGPSDLLYFTAYSQTLKDLGRTALDPRWTICPVGGIDKVPAFVALFGKRLNMAIVVDLAKGGKGKVAEAQKLTEDLLREGRVFTFASFTKKQESDVEDMLGDAGYGALVDAAYGLKPTLGVPSAPPRVLKWVEEQMRLRPSAAEFNHYHPAEHLLQHRAELLQKLPDAGAALDRFEELFKTMNKILPAV